MSGPEVKRQFGSVAGDHFLGRRVDPALSGVVAETQNLVRQLLDGQPSGRAVAAILGFVAAVAGEVQGDLGHARLVFENKRSRHIEEAFGPANGRRVDGEDVGADVADKFGAGDG